MQINSATDLIVYQKAYALAMRIFHVSQQFPPEECYSLTDQIRRASRSVCANLREAWAKRRYAADFTSKRSDCDGENSETDTWLDFAKDFGCLTEKDYLELKAACREVGKMPGSMVNDPSKFLLTPDF